MTQNPKCQNCTEYLCDTCSEAKEQAEARYSRQYAIRREAVLTAAQQRDANLLEKITVRLEPEDESFEDPDYNLEVTSETAAESDDNNSK